MNNECQACTEARYVDYCEIQKSNKVNECPCIDCPKKETCDGPCDEWENLLNECVEEYVNETPL